MSPVDFKDYYKVLGVSKSASDKEIRAAYRKLARQYHPDVNKDKAADARFKEINEAYEVLSDPEKRRKYDQLGANWKQYEQAQRTGGRGGATTVNIDDLFGGGTRSRSRGGGTSGSGGRSVSPEELEDILTESGSPFSDFFQTFFGRDRAAASATSTRPGVGRRGLDVEQPVEVTLDEAFAGTVRVVELTDDRTGQKRRIEVKIPPGVGEGSRVRIAGQGAPGTLNGAAGDLFLIVRLIPSPLFARDGDDLRVRVPVAVSTAALGGEIEVPTPKGTRLALKIPPSTQDGRVFRLRGQGMPRLDKPNERGDLFAEVHLRLPETLSPDQQRLFEQLAASGA